MKLRATVVRWDSTEFPGWLELTVRDADDRVHRIIEKTPILSSAEFTSESRLPLETWIEAEVTSTDGRYVRVRLAHGVETTEGLRQLVVSAGDLADV
ncbi:hypothetical protein ASD11_02610 [Aeromicrobium sp. Root495]|uniref:hypothetical protein n=1 Tax=Aeromicrobium sp. Root495 TaxID=1736550 RepID=UPI0007017E69|nr:hypothetical protein [Aeromicrobium sp. Root495]KQY58571.1 hypothetical protein ASD11_02610 [Aeromicrobium sp. Root495]